MKILMIITGLNMGGAERQVCALADTFASKNNNVSIISLTGDTLVKPINSNIKIFELNMAKSPIGLIKALFQAKKIIKDVNPNVIHSHMIHANIFSRLLRLIVKFPKLINTAHSKNEGGTLRKLAYRYTDKLTNLTTNVSKEAVDTFIEQKLVPINKIKFVPNGMDSKKFKFSTNNRLKMRQSLAINDNTQLFLAVGRLTLAKNYPNLLKAFAKLEQTTGKPVQLAIIGQGELEHDIKSLAEELNISSCIHFLGIQMNVEEWLSAADFYVLSSSWEGSPLVLAEAMLTERLIIATDCGGVKELLGNTGILVETENSQKFLEGMLYAMNMPESQKETLIYNAREKIINEYSLEKITDQWIDIYKQ